MKRILAGTLMTIALVAGAVFAVGASNGSSGSYKVRAIFDDVASAVPGEDVKIAGAKVGKVESMDVTPQEKAAVVLDITDNGFAPFHIDAHCTIRPQSLIGEKFVECDPGSLRQPKLRTIPDGQPGAGQHYLPLRDTSAPVDLDLINNIMRLPYRQRFSILLSELGAGFAGRGEDLNAVIHRANPALRQTDRVLKQLADENVILKNLASESDQALAPLARDRQHLSGFITHANAVGEATAQQSQNIQRSIALLPEFLRQLKPTLVDLGSLADEMQPTLADLNQASPDLASFVMQLGPFSRSATKSLVSLGKATDVGGPVLQRAQPVVKDLRSFAANAKPVSQNLDSLTASLDRTGGLEQAMNYIFFQMMAINGFDEIGHYLRASLLVNVCSTYATTQSPGCGAHFAQTKSVNASSVDATSTSALNSQAQSKAARTARALATVAKGLLNLGGNSTNNGRLKALGQQGVRRLRAAVASDSSPALASIGAGRDQALLNYLMGPS